MDTETCTSRKLRAWNSLNSLTLGKATCHRSREMRDLQQGRNVSILNVLPSDKDYSVKIL